MPNEWTIDPSNPRQYVYTDEAGNVHRAPVYKEDVSVVPRDKNGNVIDVTFPNYKPPAGQPAPQQPAPPAERRGWGDRFADSWKEAGQRGSMGVISRNGLYYSGYGKEEVARMFPNLSPEEQDKKRWELITATQKRMRSEADARRAADPTWKPDRTFVEQVTSGDWIPDLAGQIFGGFGPENAIAPGSNTALRVIGQGVIGGVTNAASQGADIYDSVAEDFDPTQVGMDVLASMGGQAILEGLGKVAARGKARLFGEDPKVDTPDTPAAPVAPEKYVIPVEDRVGIEDMLRSGASLDDIKAKYPRAVFGKNGTTLQWYINNRGKWKKVNWTGEDAPGATGSGVNEPIAPNTPDEIVVTGDKSTLELKPSDAIGPNGERVEVLPERLDDGDGRTYREFRIRDENGDITHQGEIYDNGIVAGHGELPVDANFIRFAAKGQESLDNLAPGSPVDPTKSVGMSENIDPELAMKFDEEFGAVSPVGRHNPDNFVEPVVSPSGKFTHDEPVVAKNGSRKIYSEFTPDGADKPLEIDIFIDKDGSATINIETKKIDTATEHAGKTGPDAVREGLDEVLQAFPDIKEIKGIRKVGDRTGRVEREQKIPASVVERMRKRAAEKATAEPVTPTAERTAAPEEAPTLDHTESDPTAINPEDVLNRMNSELARAKKATKEQVALNETIRRDRFREAMKARDLVGGEAGYRAAKAKLKGEYQKIEREPLAEKFNQEQVDSVFNMLAKHPDLSSSEQFRATEALAKLLSGERMQMADITLLSRVMPKDFVSNAMKARSFKDKATHFLGEAINLPRALRSSMDLSVLLRQAWNLTTRKEFYKGIPSMFHQAFSEKEFKNVMSEIRTRPSFDAMENSGLAFSDLSHGLEGREEAFMSNWAEKIPVIGRLVRGSERGFTGFLNKVRADVFDDLVKKAEKIGKDTSDPEFLNDLSGYINNATGRGSLGKFSQAAPFLNGLLFSPRLMSSRLALLNPIYYASLDPFVRKQAIRDLLGASALTVSALTLAAAGGLNVETDPRSSDFGKIRDGNDRHDILGGFGQYITFFARLASNKTLTSKGIEQELGQGRFSKTRLGVLESFLRSKASPIAGYLANYADGKNIVGEPFDAKKDTLELFTPMFLQDVYEVWRDEGPENLGKLVPEFFGTGFSSYNNAPAFDRLGQQNDKQGGRMPGGFFTGDPANKPVVDELARIEAATGKELYKPVSKKDVKDFQMTDEQFYNYQYYAGAYIREDLKQVFASPEYQQASEEDKVKMVKEVVKDQKANARDLLFPKQ